MDIIYIIIGVFIISFILKIIIDYSRPLSNRPLYTHRSYSTSILTGLFIMSPLSLLGELVYLIKKCCRKLYRNEKKKVTREQLSDVLYLFANKFSVDYVPYEMGKENSLFKNANKDIFIHERRIMIFWIIDKFFADEERKLMAAVHKIYFTDLDISNNQEETKKEIAFIMSRYKEYYDAYNDKAGPEQYILGGVIAKNILQQNKPVLNSLIAFTVAMDVMLLIKQLKESIFDKFEIVG